jgi:hypothetical protein
MHVPDQPRERADHCVRTPSVFASSSAFWITYEHGPRAGSSFVQPDESLL